MREKERRVQVPTLEGKSRPMQEGGMREGNRHDSGSFIQQSSSFTCIIIIIVESAGKEDHERYGPFDVVKS